MVDAGSGEQRESGIESLAVDRVIGGRLHDRLGVEGNANPGDCHPTGEIVHVDGGVHAIAG